MTTDCEGNQAGEKMGQKSSRTFKWKALVRPGFKGRSHADAGEEHSRQWERTVQNEWAGEQ